MMSIKTLLFLVLCWKGYALSDSVVSLVISTAEPVKTREIREITNNVPKIGSMEIKTKVANRFATTVVKSIVRNSERTNAEARFVVVLPESAFISSFKMTIGNKIFKAKVEEKSKAQQIYDNAVAGGLSGGLVTESDSKTFNISVNIQPTSEIEFLLEYEELLQRRLGMYELVIDIRPGQIVDDLSVLVRIDETRPLAFVRTPALRTSNRTSSNTDPNPAASITTVSETSVLVTFNLDVEQQKNFARQLGGSGEDGIAGQFIVEYDVKRDPYAGEVLVNDGYFAHFFAPSGLTPLEKHVVFALDHSGSMSGKKLQQLTEAMQNILSQLNPNDLFDMVRFHTGASVWNVRSQKFETVSLGFSPNWNHLGQKLKTENLPAAVPATPENIQRAKNAVKDHRDLGLTNMIAGLDVGLFLIDRTEKMFPKKYQPIIVFLTDGLPIIGITDIDKIIKIITEINKREHSTSIFSLSFGENADKEFLRKLAANNFGFSRHIYTTADASLQLTDFYKSISLPLLKNVNFKYVDGVTNVVKTYNHMLFDGSEIVTTGKTKNHENILVNVNAQSTNGTMQLVAQKTNPIGSLERLWAYLTIKKLLEDRQLGVNVAKLTQEALNLSLKYSFVTPVTSLVVVHDVNFLEAVTKQGFVTIGIRGHEIEGGKTIFNPTIPRPLQVPDWLQDLRGISGIISTPEGDFKLDPEQSTSMSDPCDPPLGTVGVCTNVFHCEEAYPVLTDLKTYLKYFCSFNSGFAGVCCPVA